MSNEYALEKQPLIRVMALHALAYCERLFYLEEVEEIRVADTRVYDGRRFHETIPDYSGLEHYTIESESLGLYGKVDTIRTAGGKLLPYEYKKGRCRSDDGTYRAWPSDELQLGAYMMLVEEFTGQPINEGRVYYAADHRTVEIVLSDDLRREVVDAVNRARMLRVSPYRPKVSVNERLCPKCSLAPVCFPEEERLVEAPERETLRLFPEDRESLDLHVVVPGSTVRKKGDMLVIDRKDAEEQTVPMHQVGSVTIHGASQVTTQTLQACAYKGIHIHWLTGGGKYIGSMANAAGAVQRKWRQYRGLSDQGNAMKLAIALVTAKVESQLRYMLRLSRGSELRGEMEGYLQTIKTMLRKAHKAASTDELLGFEGNSARAYFACLSILTHAQHGEGMAFTNRSKRPPKDAPNALLSFLYALLYKDCVQSILTVGLDPVIGFYHQPRSSGYPLALDLMELFRVALCDMIVMGSIGRKQWSLQEDFTLAGEHVWLTDEGKKKAVSLYERRKQDKWKHPVIGYSLSYARLIELEVRLLEKEWSGSPGLFARRDRSWRRSNIISSATIFVTRADGGNATRF